MAGTRSFQNEARLRAFIRVSLGLFLVSPFLIWLIEISDWSWPGLAEVSGPLRASVMQATLSTLATLFLGALLARAHLGWPRSQYSEAALLMPNLIPPLFIAMGLLSWSSVSGFFPYGMGAVIAAHVLLNSGLVALSLARILQSKTAGYAEAAWVMGASAPRFWRNIAWSLIRAEVFYLALFIFSLHFTSFSLPLLLGGERSVTLEVAIFDTIRLDGRWDKAVILAALQSIFLLACAFVLPKDVWPQKVARARIPYLAAPRVRLFTFVPIGILLIGWGLGFARATTYSWDSEWTEVVLVGLLTSVILALLVGGLHLALFLVIAYASPHARLERFLNGYFAPSPSITGFGLLLLPVASEVGRILLCAVALTLISLPLLYRWMVGGALAALKRQVSVARTLGATAELILFQVVWPQVAPVILRASGLAALWASGDFAISRILLGSDLTLPLVMESFLNNYRYESAELLLVPLAFLGILVYAGFAGASRYVTR